MYEDEFELTFQVPEEESAPEPLAAPAAKPAAPVEPVADEAFSASFVRGAPRKVTP